MDFMPYLVGVVGFSSTLHFVNLTLSPKFSASSSTMGAIALHGPHQGAQKSTRTGLSDYNTSDSKLLSPTSRISFAIKLFPFCIFLKL
jgi:hypothetical protein